MAIEETNTVEGFVRIYTIYHGGGPVRPLCRVYISREYDAQIGSAEALRKMFIAGNINIFPFPEVEYLKNAEVKWTLWLTGAGDPNDLRENIGTISGFKSGIDSRSRIDNLYVAADIMRDYIWNDINFNAVRITRSSTETESVDHFNRVKARGSKRKEPCLKHIPTAVLLKEG